MSEPSSLLTDEARAYIGIQTEFELACDAVEPGAVRRYAHAIMDADRIFAGGAEAERYGGPVAPLIYPTHMFRRASAEGDPLEQTQANPDYDGSSVSSTQGLPEIAPLKKLAILNGGLDIEFYRYAKHGERVKVRSRYSDIVEKQSSKGPMVLVFIESDYVTADDELLCRVRRTYIRR